jgi:hypothetical protein
MSYHHRDDTEPKPGAPEPSYRAKRDAIHHANAGYLISHGLRPAEERPEPTEAPSTVEHVTDRARRPR